MSAGALRVGCISRPSVNPVFSRFPQRRNYLLDRFPRNLVECVPIPITPSGAPLLYLSYLQGLVRAFRDTRRLSLDVLLVEDMESALLGLALRAAFACPLVFDFIDDYAEITRFDGRPARHLAVRGLERIIPRASDLVIVTDDVKRRYCLTLGLAPGKVVTIPNGFDPSRFYPAPMDVSVARRFGVEGRRVVTFIGKLTPYYGLETIVRALPLVAARYPDVVFLCVGSGSAMAGLRDLATRLGVASNLCIPGPVSCSEVAGLINLSEVCLLSVPTEAALVLYEYLACARPVIVPLGGTEKMTVSRESFPEDSVLRVERSPGAYARGILRLLEDGRAAQAMGLRGRRRVLEHNTWDVLSVRYINAIRKISGASRRAAQDTVS